MRTGIVLPERNPNERQLHPEVQRGVGPQSIVCTGTWASAHRDAASLNIRVVTKGFPVVTQRFLSDYRATPDSGTGSALKSFILKQ